VTSTKPLRLLSPVGLVDRIGETPRRRLLAWLEWERAAADGRVAAPSGRPAFPRPTERTDGEHFAAFCRLLRHTKGSFAGRPFELEAWEREFCGELLRFDDQGRRVYRIGLLGIPRKNGKTTLVAAIALYLGSPCEAEPEPEVLLTAGSKDQAGPLFKQAARFIEKGDPVLEHDFDPLATTILRRDGSAGTIVRLSSDGKLHHGANPNGTAVDELHAWITPKQVEMWAALTTAEGARDDPVMAVITTAGHNLETILGELYRAARESPLVELRPEFGAGGFEMRDPEAGMLVQWYGVDAQTVTAVEPELRFTDPEAWAQLVDAFVAANPAEHRSRARLERDLIDRRQDGPTKIRLYGNGWTTAKARWISDVDWYRARELELEAGPTQERLLDELEAVAEQGYAAAVGVDAARTRDTSAVGWCWKDDEGLYHVRARVWSVRRDAPAHVHVDGRRIRNGELRDFIRGPIASRVPVLGVFYDERFFSSEADELDDDGFVVVEMHQGQVEMETAWNAFYDDVPELVRHPADHVLTAHVQAAAGEKAERGWRVRKLRATSPIDALAAVVMARHGAASLDYTPDDGGGLLVLGR
jgi:phage terminase large subunit-like protein